MEKIVRLYDDPPQAQEPNGPDLPPEPPKND